MPSLALAHDRRLRDLDREVARRPEDPGAWLALVRQVRRLRQPLPAWAPPRLGLARLLEFWRQDPDERAWERYLAPLTGLRPGPTRLGRAGRYWSRAGRLREREGRAYDARSGLPLLVVRHLDGALMRLVPREALRAAVAARGGAPEEPVEAFYLDAVPVTLGRFLQVEEARLAPDAPRSLARTARAQGLGPRCPAILITHRQATRYARWVDAVLPRAHHWGAAAAGVEGSSYPWGEEPPTPGRANYDPIRDRRRSRSQVRLPRSEERLLECLHPVGTYPEGAGPFGHLDLVGTVAEWLAPDPIEGEVAGAHVSTAGGGWLTSRRGGVNAHDLEARRGDVEFVDVGLRCARLLT